MVALHGEEFAINHIKTICEIMTEDPELSQPVKDGIKKIFNSFIQDLNKNVN